jgi:hypothetical protein
MHHAAQPSFGRAERVFGAGTAGQTGSEGFSTGAAGGRQKGRRSWFRGQP